MALLLEAFEALLAGELPSLEARLFMAGGGLAWLRSGGNLERSYWRVAAPAGSHRTPSAIAADLDASSRGATQAIAAETISTSETSSDGR